MGEPIHLSEQIQSMRLGDHTCLIYDSFEEQMAVTIPFMKLGLERNEACVYLCDETSFEEIREAFDKAGIDTATALARGALVMITKREAYLRSGYFEPQAMIDFLHNSMKEAVERGFSGFRVMGEMTWALGQECGCHNLIEYEALLNNFFPGSQVVAICQYNRRRFAPEMIRDVLRTHPIAILGDQVCTNLYYETPEMVLGRESIEGKVEWMIEQLKRFRKTEQRLEKSVQMRDDFLSIASHELRTPLTTLKLQNDLFLQDLKKGTPLKPEDWSELLDTNRRQILQLTKLVDDMLDISCISQGALSMECAQMNLECLVKQVIAQQRQAAPKAQIHLNVEDPLEGTWDASRIEQVICNLISNAIKFGSHKPVLISLRREKGWALLSIQDHGIGIPPEKLGRIFEKFERAARNISGLGLGLYISKQIVEAHRGHIDVQSQPGESTIFTVRLPLHCEANAEKGARPSLVVVSG